MIDSITFNDLFNVNPSLSSGIEWKVKRGPKAAGSIAGSRDPNGYWRVGLAGKQHLTHRVVWAMVHGPIDQGFVIDHIDGNKDNNSITNLRMCNQADNTRNRGMSVHNTSGFKGVTKRGRKWVAQIQFDGQKKYLGLFATPELASEAYEEAAVKLFGEYKRNNTEEV